MKTTMKIKTLFIAAAACAVTGVVAINNTAANAEETPRFYMEAGAAVNLEEGYGGIRWTTVVEAGYNASAANVTYGTFVLPTAMYEAEKASKAVAEMTGVVDIPSEVDPSANEGNTKYYSAIKYDDIVEDYKAANAGVAVNETELLTKAYQMELTAISYALIGNEYTYAEVVETSRSARQVANMAELDGKLKNASAEKKAQITAYITTGATSFVREESDEEGYLDLTELAQTTPVAQNITVSSKMAELDWTANVKEVLVGANKVDYTYADGVLTLSEGTATAVAGEETYLSVFDNSGNVYNMIIVPADGVITTAQELNDTFLVKNAEGVDATPLYGYYVLGNDIVGDGNGKVYNMSLTINDVAYLNGGTDGSELIVRDKLGGFYGTFDGRGHTISKLATRKYGIFGWMVNATIKNIGFTDITSYNNGNGSNMVFAQYAYNTSFENVYVDMKFERTNGNSVVGRARSCTFNNFILNISSYTGTNTASRAWGFFATAYVWDEVNGKQHYGENNAFTNTYMVSTSHVMELGKKTAADGTVTITSCVDGANWATPTAGTSVNHTESNIKRYLSMADMIANKYYNVDGSENTAATKTENDWSKFDSKYWTVTNEGISWN